MMASVQRRSAFTLVELLVVMGIIGLLLALLLPTLGSAHGAAEKSRELNKLRQVGAGWSIYSDDYSNRVLPGYLDPTVQEAWNVEYKIAYDDSSVPRSDAATYPWRLLPYMSNQHSFLHDYAHEEEADPRDHVAEIASEPAFGYNAIYLGGWFERVEPNGRPVVRFETANVIARTQSQIGDSSNIVVFASSGERRAGDRYSNVQRNFPGSHYVVPPIVAQSGQWVGEADVVRVLADTAAPIMRYTQQIAVVFADGHTAAESPGGLNDQRNWIVTAETADFTHQP